MRSARVRYTLIALLLAPTAFAPGVALAREARPRAAAQESEAHDRYKRGMAAYALEDWDTAISEFEAGFRLDPTPAFLYNIAQSHRKAKRLDQALKFYRKYLEMAGDEAKDKGEVQSLITTIERAMAEQSRALSQPPNAVTDGANTSGGTAATTPGNTASTAPPTDGTTPTTSPAPAPAPATEKKRDAVGLALVGTGAAVLAVGVGLVVGAVVLDGQAGSASGTADLNAREQMYNQAGALAPAGYVAIGVGAAVLVGGVIKLALGARAGHAVRPTTHDAALAWSF